MSKVRKIFNNLFFNYSSAIIVAICSLSFTVIIARYLGSSGYGIFSYSLAYIAIITAFNDFGFATVAIREIAKDPSKTQRYFSNVFTLKFVLSVIVFLTALAVIPIFKKDPLQAKVLLLFTSAGFIYMFQASYRWIFQAHQAFEYDALLNIAQGVLSLALLMLVIFLKKGVVVIAGVWIILYLIVTVIGFFLVHRIVKFKFVLDKELLKRILPSAFILGLISIVSILYLYVDKVILFQMKGSQEVGLYSAASKIMLSVRGIVFLYMPVAFPAFSSFSMNMNDRYFHKFLTRSFNYILIISSAIALGGAILAPQIMNLVFGAEYMDAISSLKILMWALPLTCLNGLITCSFIGIGLNKESFIVGGLGLALNILINILFIGNYGYYATSIALVISELMMFAMFAVLAYKRLELKVSMAKMFQIFLALCFMGLFLLRFHSANLMLSIVLGALLYALSLIVFRAINQDDWILLRKVMLKQI